MAEKGGGYCTRRGLSRRALPVVWNEASRDGWEFSGNLLQPDLTTRTQKWSRVQSADGSDSCTKYFYAKSTVKHTCFIVLVGVDHGKHTCFLVVLFGLFGG